MIASAALPLSHPAFGPFAPWLQALGTAGDDGMAADIPALNHCAGSRGLALPDGRPLAFAPATGARPSALAYERGIAAAAVVPVRAGSLHDACNALAWLAFPHTKGALNALHAAAAVAPTPNARDRRRDAATLLDESGLVVACADAALVALWRAKAWRALFWDRRADVVRALRAVALGHGLLAKLVRPFRAATAHALVLPLPAATLPADPPALATALDVAAAAWLAARGAALTPGDLLPLPVAALPGWDREGLGAALFDDATVFRPARERRRAAGVSC
jgi:hypothetical protein